MGSEIRQLHIFLFPFMSHGHMLPMIDIAKLFAERGVRATIVLTPGNASLFENSVDRAKKVGYLIEVHLLWFSSFGTSLSEGGENFDYVSNSAENLKLIDAINVLEEPFNQLVEEQRPDAIISDMFLPWTVNVSDKLGIPRLVFYGSNYFSLCVGDSLRRFSPEKNMPCGHSQVLTWKPTCNYTEVAMTCRHVWNQNLGGYPRGI